MTLRNKEKEPSNTTLLDPFFGTGGFSNTTLLMPIFLTVCPPRHKPKEL